jgi:hypothetical protein
MLGFETLCFSAFFTVKFNFKEFMNLTKNIQALTHEP